MRSLTTSGWSGPRDSAAPPPKPETRDRLRRVLFLVPYAVRHPGIPVKELARRCGVSEKELLDDLDFLLGVGCPPFAPDDFLDLYVEGMWKTTVDSDAHLHVKGARVTKVDGMDLLTAESLYLSIDGSLKGSADGGIELKSSQPIRRWRTKARGTTVGRWRCRVTP